MIKTPTVYFITLGCKVNASETEGMRQLFEDEGYLSVTENEMADVIIVNTCTVTQMSDKKSRQMIRKARTNNPDAILAAVGCYIQVSPEIAKTIPGVDILLGNNEKHLIVKMVQKIKRARIEKENSNGNDKKLAMKDLYGKEESTQANECASHLLKRSEMNEFEYLPIEKFEGHSRAFIKIQDGCDQFCSYCIIPFARGPVRSRDKDDVLNEINRLVKSDYTEVVLTGIHLTSYSDIKYGVQPSLLGLVQDIQSIDGIKRIRFGSLEPLHIGKTILQELKKCDKFCPHFHLSLQSGCGETLKRMNRNYSPEEFSTIVKDIRAYFPDATIATDIMVGFPGETEDEFEASFSFCKTIEFSWMHVFPYSQRKGTHAAKLKDQVESVVKTTRAKKMNILANRMREKAFEKLLNQTTIVLFEQKLLNDPEWMIGYTSNYIQVAAKTDLDLKGQYRRVYLEKLSSERILGTIQDE